MNRALKKPSNFLKKNFGYETPASWDLLPHTKKS